MIRKLAEADRSLLLRLLQMAPHYNLYMLGNCETLGFDADFCEFWGDFGAAGELRGVINRYMTGWSIFGQSGADWAGLMALLDHNEHATRLQDNPGGVASVMGYLTRRRVAAVYDEELMTLTPTDFRPRSAPMGAEVRQATLADLPGLVAFYANAGDMSRSAAGVERPLRDTRVWVAVEEGLVLSAAVTNAETRLAAMIGGVYTTPSQRNRGLSGAVCSALCVQLLAEGKQPVLYWKNEIAGALYRALGFCPAGRWRSVWLENCSR